MQEYKLYYAQSLYKAGLYEPATKACQNIDEGSELEGRVLMLQARSRGARSGRLLWCGLAATPAASPQAAISYDQDELLETKALVEQCPPDEAATIVNEACILYKEAMGVDGGAPQPEKLEQARLHFVEAMNTTGFCAETAYAIALCYYNQRQYGPALKHIAEIIEKGVREHPELSVGSQAEGIDVRSVGNSTVLKETALVEAFNLKAAIEYTMRDFEAAVEALSDMPPRADEERRMSDDARPWPERAPVSLTGAFKP